MQNVYAKNFSPYIDLLYWYASEQSSSTWATSISSGTVTGNRNIDISETNIKFAPKSGIRVGIDNKISHQFNSKFYWTYYNTSANKSLNKSAQIVVPEFWSGFLSGNFFFGATIDWDLRLNTIDLDLGQKIKIYDNFSFRPAIGIKYASIKQDIKSTWNAIIYIATENIKHDYSAIGPTISVDTNWLIYSKHNTQISLLGNFLTAILWGKWDINDSYYRPNVAGVVTSTTIVTTPNDMHLGVAMFDVLLGINWSYESKYKIDFKVGYEMQFWANQLRLLTFQQLPEHGNLTLQGLTCGIKVQF